MANIKQKIFWLLLLCWLPAIPASAYYDLGRPTGYVNDYVNVLSASEKQNLETKLTKFEQESSNEIAVAVIPSLQDDTIENFAVKLFESWKIGQADKDNGVLILVAIEDRKMRIEVGYGLEGALTDAQSYWIINNVMKPAFRENKFYTGINGAVDKIMAATKGEYVPSDKSSQSSSSKSSDKVDAVMGLAYFGFFVFITLASILARSKSWWAGGMVGGIFGIILWLILGFLWGIISLVVLVPLGLLLDYLVSSQYQKGKVTGHYPWWIGGKSGFGGSSGGGFGGFGGGSSGGGGASGSW
jgi:uncharacterized protein